MSASRVTVLLPCRDAKASFFQDALASVWSQTRGDWRLIVVDDHSTLPETLQVLKQLRSMSESRVSVIESAGSLVTGALNTGMRHAITPFVCALHADDLLDRRAIEVLHHYMEKFPETDYFHSSRRRIDETGAPLGGILRAREGFTLADFKRVGPVKALHCWHVEAALSIGGMDEALGLHGADDYDFSWCMAEAGFRFTAIQECLYCIRDHREHFRLTTHVPLDRQVNELVKIWTKHGMSAAEIEEQIRIRTAGYLRQALFLDDEDRRKKEDAGFDPRTGWRLDS